MGWSEIVIENYLHDSISIKLQINGFDHDNKRTIYTEQVLQQWIQHMRLQLWSKM